MVLTAPLVAFVPDTRFYLLTDYVRKGVELLGVVRASIQLRRARYPSYPLVLSMLLLWKGGCVALGVLRVLLREPLLLAIRVHAQVSR